MPLVIDLNCVLLNFIFYFLVVVVAVEIIGNERKINRKG
jgi:hypothetical protein